MIPVHVEAAISIKNAVVNKAILHSSICFPNPNIITGIIFGGKVTLTCPHSLDHFQS